MNFNFVVLNVFVVKEIGFIGDVIWKIMIDICDFLIKIVVLNGVKFYVVLSLVVVILG